MRSSPVREVCDQCVVFLGENSYSHSISLSLGGGGNPAMDYLPIQGGLMMLQVA